tara:strand:+ start:1588 stop:2499 length:912 start_codon:yes stop_codon:yes gene_type:complete
LITDSHLILPDVFLGGTPKSGTTFLFDLLAQHPEIVPSNPKEPFFYVDKNCPSNQSLRLNAKSSYDQFFDAKKSKLHLDGTSQTIYQSEILRVLEKASKQPKMIVILREPARRILSSFGYTKNNLGAVKSMGFKDYVDFLLKNDLEGLKKECRGYQSFYSLSNELDYSNYAKYLAKWNKVLPNENLKILLFEDIISAPEKVLEEVLDFLKLENNGFSPIIKKTNETVHVKNRLVHYLLYKMFEATGYRVPFKSLVKTIYGRFQFRQGGSSTETEDSLKRLKEYFVPMNIELKESFNLNIDKWE